MVHCAYISFCTLSGSVMQAGVSPVQLLKLHNLRKVELEKKNHDPAPELVAYVLTSTYVRI